MTVNVTERQGAILLHMTGLDRSEDAYRNHYATDPGGAAWGDLLALAAAGLVTGPHADHAGAFGGLSFFYTTDAGVAEARRLIDVPPGVN
jgi:hypothetical protein